MRIVAGRAGEGGDDSGGLGDVGARQQVREVGAVGARCVEREATYLRAVGCEGFGERVCGISVVLGGSGDDEPGA